MSRQSKQANKRKARAVMASMGNPASTTPKHGKKHRRVPVPKNLAAPKEQHEDKLVWREWKKALRESERKLRKSNRSKEIGE